MRQIHIYLLDLEETVLSCMAGGGGDRGDRTPQSSEFDRRFVVNERCGEEYDVDIGRAMICESAETRLPKDRYSLLKSQQ